MRGKIALLLFFLCIWTGAALAEEAPAVPALTTAGLQLGIHSINYPQLTGLTDEELQTAINQKIVSAGNIDTLLARLPLMMSGEVPVTVTWEGGLYGDLLSVAMCASGPVLPDGRSSEIWSTVNLYITDGTDLTMDCLIDPQTADADALLTYIADYLDYTLAPELSAHLENSALTPVPDTWRADTTGMFFYYPIDQLSTLHGRAGTVQLDWYTLAESECLNTLAEPGNPVYDVGGLDFLFAGEHTRDAVTACCADGRLPGLLSAIGEDLQPITDMYGLLTDPDIYEGGRMFALDGAVWRGAWLLTDRLHDKTWDTSIVQGIRTDRISLYGIQTGSTTQEMWQALLGVPDMSVQIDEETADLWRIVPGVSDYYTIGEYTLRLHADAEGVLTTVILQ